MQLLTDSVAFASQIFPKAKNWTPLALDPTHAASGLGELAAHLNTGNPFFRSVDDSNRDWKFAFLVEHAPFSQFDLLLELNAANVALPDRMILLAGSGEGFHGQRKRPWTAIAGNIHLVIFFRPERKIQCYHTGFPIVAAISVVEAINDMNALSEQAAIKWVNDIVIGRAKVAGFVTHVQTLEGVVKTAVLGIGLNVGQKPEVKPGPFVPEVSSLQAKTSDPAKYSLDVVLSHLLKQLGLNYRRLLSGQSSQLLEDYRKRCMVVGRQVRILSDSLNKEAQEIASGRVSGIGDNLELFIEGREEPIRRGRLILED